MVLPSVSLGNPAAVVASAVASVKMIATGLVAMAGDGMITPEGMVEVDTKTVVNADTLVAMTTALGALIAMPHPGLTKTADTVVLPEVTADLAMIDTVENARIVEVEVTIGVAEVVTANKVIHLVTMIVVEVMIEKTVAEH